MQPIAETLSKLACGAPQGFRNITLWPLLSAQPVEPAYLTHDEALERQLARISEVSESGSVPELRLANLADVPVLLVDGEELVGAKQNRILNLTILVGAHSGPEDRRAGANRRLTDGGKQMREVAWLAHLSHERRAHLLESLDAVSGWGGWRGPGRARRAGQRADAGPC